MKDKLSKQREKFLNYIGKNKDFSENTILAYKNDVEKFLKFLRENKIKDAGKVNERAAVSYYKKLKNELKDRSIMRNLSSLRKFYEYLIYAGEIKTVNPFRNIRHESNFKKEPEVLSIRKISKLFRSLSGEDFLDARDRAMILFIYSAGLRASEIAEARIDRLNLDDATYTVGTRKNKNIILFSKKIVPALKEYLRYRDKVLKRARIKKNQNKFLFVNVKGEKITRQTVYIVVQRHAEEAGLGKKVTPAILRNSLAYHLLGSGTKGEIVKEFLRYTTLLPKYSYIPNLSRTKFEYLSTHPAFKKR